MGRKKRSGKVTRKPKKDEGKGKKCCEPSAAEPEAEAAAPCGAEKAPQPPEDVAPRAKDRERVPFSDDDEADAEAEDEDDEF